jgi:hypothetical protein
LGKVILAMDSNTRATRHSGQTLESMAESLRTHSRSNEKYNDEQRYRRDEGTTIPEKRPRTDDKGNSPTLKSVVNKKKNNRNQFVMHVLLINVNCEINFMMKVKCF